MKTCVACGMPMSKDEDFAKGDPSLDYCVHCARPDGSMQSYDEKRESLTGFIVNTQGLDRAAARGAAESMMRRLPAWQGHLG